MSTITRTPRQAAILAERDRLRSIQDNYRREGNAPGAMCIHGTSFEAGLCWHCEEGVFTTLTPGFDLLVVARDIVDEEAAEERRIARREADRARVAREKRAEKRAILLPILPGLFAEVEAQGIPQPIAQTFLTVRSFMRL